MDWDTARSVWSNEFATRYATIPTGRVGNSPEKKQLIKDLWEYKTADGLQFSLRSIARLMRYKNGDHTSVRQHIINMGLTI